MTSHRRYFFHEDVTPWDELFSRAHTLVSSLGRGAGTRWLVQPATIDQGITGILAAILAGAEPTIDEKGLRRSAGYDVILGEEVLRCAQDDGGSAQDDGGSAQADLIDEILSHRGNLLFSTSGSTGEPALIVKPFQGLLKEARELGRLYGLEPGGHLVGLASPLHIYGFLNGFLLPLLLDANCWFVDARTLKIPRDLPQKIDLLFTVPAVWQLSQQLMTGRDVGCFVTSAGAFGQKRRAELQGLEHPPSRCLEIFGSTETGGLGHRDLLSRQEAFTPFPGIVIDPDETGCVVKSPFLSTAENQSGETHVADRFEVCGNAFRFLGRADRIIKHAGRRYALQEIENAIAESFPCGSAHCVYLESEDRPQGGRLVVIMETSCAPDLAFLRQWCGSQGYPAPSRLVAVSGLPRDPNGKIPHAELIRLART